MGEALNEEPINLLQCDIVQDLSCKKILLLFTVDVNYFALVELMTLLSHGPIEKSCIF